MAILTQDFFADAPESRFQVMQNSDNSRFNILQYLLPITAQHINHVIIRIFCISYHRQVKIFYEFIIFFHHFLHHS